LVAAFADPSAAFRGKPFWSWNGRLERTELLRQLGVMREMGMGGVFMHARTGLETEYLGREWFELINACADRAESLGLESWLYDEDRWPSGSAGGLATADPSLRLRYLRLSRPATGGFMWHFVKGYRNAPVGARWAGAFASARVQKWRSSPHIGPLPFVKAAMETSGSYRGRSAQRSNSVQAPPPYTSRTSPRSSAGIVS
jgi:hypothetical protein